MTAASAIATQAPLSSGAEHDARLWRRVAYFYALLIGAGIAYFLFRMPFQVNDNVGDILAIQSQPLGEVVRGHFTDQGYLRPLFWGLIKLVFDVSAGGHFVAYRAVDATQVLLLLALFVRLLDVRSRRDFEAVLIAIAVLVGIHTFNGTVREAFPLNHYLTILVCCVLVANLSFSSQRWWSDAGAVAVLPLALLTIESGVLVWVALLTAFAVGARGVSWRGLASATAALGLYLYFRFGPLAVGAPDLWERSTGFGFTVLDPPELVQRFGRNAAPLYVYNVIASALSVLFSEPRAGVWRFVDGLFAGSVPAWRVVNIAASAAATALIGWFVVIRVPRWRQRRFDRADQLVLVFFAVLTANAVLSYAYTKDVIMSPAGVFYASAVFAATRELLGRVTQARRYAPAVAAAILGLLSITWSIRAAGLGSSMRYQAFVNRNDWAAVYETLDRNQPGWRTPAGERLVAGLRRDAVDTRVPNPHFTPRRLDRLFDPQ